MLTGPWSCRLRDCHPLWSAFPYGSVNQRLCNSHVKDPTTPQGKTLAVWAVSRSLAATNEITKLFSLPSGTKMVHFPELASIGL